MTIVEELRALLGDRAVLDAEATLDTRSLDTWPLRLVERAIGVPGTRPLCVVRPRTTGDLAGALALLYSRDVGIVPYGGGSGVLGGAMPPAGATVIDVGEMADVVALDERDLFVRAQAGVPLGSLEAHLNTRGLTTGHYPQSIAVAQLGGLVATRSSGQFSTKYGGIEDAVLGLEAVLPDGTVTRVSETTWRSGGPDLRELWIGSEGAFGVISEVTLRVLPTPERRWLGAFAFPRFALGLEALRAIMRAGLRPGLLRLYDDVETQRSYAAQVRAGESLLLAIVEGPSEVADAERDAITRVIGAAARSLGAAPVEQWLRERNEITEFNRLIGEGVLVDTIDVLAPWSRIREVYEDSLAALRRMPELIAASAHASHVYPHGANLYFIVGARPERTAADVERVYEGMWSAVMDAVERHGGATSHHHGIGKARAARYARELGSSYEVLRRIKRALDPKGLMNPGTLIDGR
ncbi:MAG TPA: FAD-binding oxidoreductase [Candidatus Limnocylindria bacterium]|nr:FAD-binding oxidoreductase [Candidatus Limnocylindria bacterium]